MFAVGHIALGYLAGKCASKLVKVDLNIPIVITCSLLPDIDLLFPMIDHRGPSHSILLQVALFLPFLFLWTRKSLPYFSALLTHSLIGDTVTAVGVQLFWPFSTGWVRYIHHLITNPLNEAFIEILLFIVFVLVIISTGDLRVLIQPDRSNLQAVIPISTIVLPGLFYYPVRIPDILIIPHVIVLVLLSASFMNTIINLREFRT